MASTMLLNPLVCGTIERVNVKQSQVELQWLWMGSRTLPHPWLSSPRSLPQGSIKNAHSLSEVTCLILKDSPIWDPREGPLGRLLPTFELCSLLLPTSALNSPSSGIYTQVTSWEGSHTSSREPLQYLTSPLKRIFCDGLKWSESHDQGFFHCKWFIPVETVQVFFLREISPAYLASSLKNNIIIEKNREHHTD